ncbi:hypothetical protein Godav_024355 [Gossypium davidsonii]|uniref:Uncharacterized protein n=1 Tax=Gossypium davidsonii TaxID=34287 RepID=A0A7J8SUU4_GOSDV|nr:hypothetical protein [Gossypium davidsonii]
MLRFSLLRGVNRRHPPAPTSSVEVEPTANVKIEHAQSLSVCLKLETSFFQVFEDLSQHVVSLRTAQVKW